MQKKTFDYLFIFSLFFTAQWFFGNLYEEIVIVPNQLSDSFEKLKHFQAFFSFTNPVFFYVPFTILAIPGIVVLFIKSDNPEVKALLRKAVISVMLALLVSIVLISQIIKIFFGDLEKYRDSLHGLTIAWLIGNVFRIILVGITFAFTFRAYLLLQRN